MEDRKTLQRIDERNGFWGVVFNLLYSNRSYAVQDPKGFRSHIGAKMLAKM